MPLPPLVAQAATAALDAFCLKRIPPEFRDQIQLVHSARGNTVTLTEERRHWQNPERRIRRDIARFRFHPETGTWQLYWADRNERWHLYEDARPTAHIVPCWPRWIAIPPASSGDEERPRRIRRVCARAGGGA